MRIKGTILDQVYDQSSINSTPTLIQSFKDSIPTGFVSTTVNNPDSTFTFVDPIRGGLTGINEFTSSVVKFPEKLNELDLPLVLKIFFGIIGVLIVLGAAFFFRGSSGGV